MVRRLVCGRGASGWLRGGAAGGEQVHEGVSGEEHLIFGGDAQVLEQARPDAEALTGALP